MKEIKIIHHLTNKSNIKLKIGKSVFYKDKRDMKIGE
jgi:hypothetical protein